MAAHEVQRPVFYSIGIIITAYIPIFTLQRVEGRLFKPMAWTVSFALLGALIFAMLIAPVLSSFLFRGNVKEWKNPLMTGMTNGYRWLVRTGYSFPLDHGGDCARRVRSVGMADGERADRLGVSAASGRRRHLGARHAGAKHRSHRRHRRGMNHARVIIASFPEVTQVVSQVGRPDDGTDTTGFFNTEYLHRSEPERAVAPGVPPG